MSNKLKEDFENYYDYDMIENKCHEEIIQFDKEYLINNNVSLNEGYIKNNFEDIISGNYFIPYPLLVYIDRLYGFKCIDFEDNNFVRRNLEIFDKEHTWFDGWGMKKIYHGINWFFDDVKNFEYILLYLVSKFIEWYPEHSELLIIKDNL